MLGPQTVGPDTHYDISDDIVEYVDVTTIGEFIEVFRSRRGLEHAVDPLVEMASNATRSESRAPSRLERPNDERSTDGIWLPDGLRVFVTHVSNVRQDVGDLARDLDSFGLTCFVAHDAIEPSREWQATIEDALATMDTMVAYVTTDFHASKWTDQEVGWALGRETLIVPINAGQNPYGSSAHSKPSHYVAPNPWRRTSLGSSPPQSSDGNSHTQRATRRRSQMSSSTCSALVAISTQLVVAFRCSRPFRGTRGALSTTIGSVAPQSTIAKSEKRIFSTARASPPRWNS